jgi:hypothetical protein
MRKKDVKVERKKNIEKIKSSKYSSLKRSIN